MSERFDLHTLECEAESMLALARSGSATPEQLADVLRFADFVDQNASKIAKQRAAEVELLDDDWKHVPGWPEYQCSIHGNVRRVARATGSTVFKILGGSIGTHGYPVVSFSRPGQKKQDRLVHRLVVETFVSPIPDGMDVCHFDGNKLNPALQNLRIDSRKGNMADQIRHGKTPRGEKCGSNKYPRETILKARELMDGGERPAAVARLLGIPASYVYAIKNRVVWGWL